MKVSIPVKSCVYLVKICSNKINSNNSRYIISAALLALQVGEIDHGRGFELFGLNLDGIKTNFEGTDIL